MVKNNIIALSCAVLLAASSGSMAQSNQLRLAKLIYKWHANKLALIDHCRTHFKGSAHKLQQARQNYIRLNQSEIRHAKSLLGNSLISTISQKISARYRKMQRGEYQAIFEAKSCKKRIRQQSTTRKPNRFKLSWEEGLKKVRGQHLRTCLFRKYNKMYSDRYEKTIQSDFHAFWRPPKNVTRGRCTVGILQDQRGRVLNVRYLQCGNPRLKQSAAALLRSRRLPRAPCKEVFKPYVKFTFY